MTEHPRPSRLQLILPLSLAMLVGIISGCQASGSTRETPIRAVVTATKETPARSITVALSPTLPVSATPSRGPSLSPSPSRSPTIPPVTATPAPSPQTTATRGQVPSATVTALPTAAPSAPAPTVPVCAHIGNSNTHKFHRPTCSYAQKIADENRVCLHSREEAIAQGYEPCGHCKP